MASIESVLLSSVSHLQSFAIVSAAFVGVILWDLVYCIGAEVEYIYINEIQDCWRKRRLPSLPNVLLFNARLLTLPIIGLYLAVLSPNSLTDERRVVLFKVMWYLLVPALANAITIFVIRTIAIRSSRLPMKIFLWSFGTGVVGFFLYQVIHQEYSPTYFSYFPQTPSAEEIRQLDSIWLHWVITASLIVLLDVTIFVLSLATRYNGGQWVSTQSKLGEIFFEDAISYFFLTSSVSIMEVIWISLHRHEGVYMAMILPIQVWLALSISPRVLRNLKLASAKEKFQSKANILSMQIMSKSNRNQAATMPRLNVPNSPQPPSYQGKSLEIPYRNSVWIEESAPVVQFSPSCNG